MIFLIAWTFVVGVFAGVAVSIAIPGIREQYWDHDRKKHAGQFKNVTRVGISEEVEHESRCRRHPFDFCRSIRRRWLMHGTLEEVRMLPTATATKLRRTPPGPG